MREYTKEELRALIEGKLRRNFGRVPTEANPAQMFFDGPLFDEKCL